MLSLTPSEVLRKSTRLPEMKAAVLSSWGLWGGHKDTVPPKKALGMWPGEHRKGFLPKLEVGENKGKASPGLEAKQSLK